MFCRVPPLVATMPVARWCPTTVANWWCGHASCRTSPASNQRLTAGGVVGGRSFQIGEGDLRIGDEVKARRVDISVDAGSLTVAGRIDASASRSAASACTPAISCRWTARWTRTVPPARGQPWQDHRQSQPGHHHAGQRRRCRRPGQRGAAGPACGQRRCRWWTSWPERWHPARHAEDRCAAAGQQRRGDCRGHRPAHRWRGRHPAQWCSPLRRCAPATTADVRGNRAQLVTQQWLDQVVDPHSVAWIDGARGNADLQQRTRALGDVRLRPGVQVLARRSDANPDGDLTIAGDIDLSGYRYGPDANRADPSRRGFGESASLVLRAEGNINVYGSINDGSQRRRPRRMRAAGSCTRVAMAARGTPPLAVGWWCRGRSEAAARHRVSGRHPPEL